MTIYEKFRKLSIDHSAIGLELSDDRTAYYCTPKNAQILGWAGVDGIHYCTIPEFGEMVFAVSPMNFGDCVHPIARNFEDLLRLLLHCVDMAALEQCYAWDEEQFNAFLLDCPTTERQQKALDSIREAFGLEPMKDAFAYLKQLQAEFDFTKIPYTEDYYDPDMNAAAPERPEQWAVTFHGGFRGVDGEAGREVPIGKAFVWDGESWYVPAAYVCREGLVVDYCLEVAPDQVNAFFEKWGLLKEDQPQYTEEQQEQIRREHPLNAHFYGKATVNGQLLENGHGCGLSWLAQTCFPMGARQDPETERFLNHYGLDRSRAWSIHRWCYEWNDEAPTELNSLSVLMERQPQHIPGERFMTPAVGESICLMHPVTGGHCTLTVRSLDPQELPKNLLGNADAQCPNHFLAMSYTLEPDIAHRGLMIQDCAHEDPPRQKNSSTGIIGRSHGPSAILMAPKSQNFHVACSSLHFEPPKTVQWRPVFSVKTKDDMEITLL